MCVIMHGSADAFGGIGDGRERVADRRRLGLRELYGSRGTVSGQTVEC